MPPVPPTKFARTSIEGWSRKRSVSPSAKASSSKKVIGIQGSADDVDMSPDAKLFVPRRSDDGYYYEDEYRDEHVMCMLDNESQTLAQPELMDQQPELQWRMRPYLIDFVVEIHSQFRLRPEVLYLACNIVDRYVSKRVVFKKHYQLVGCASLWIAAKFEDSKERVPLVRELHDMCCGAYEQSAFIQMEGHILSTIGWNVVHPTGEGWLRSYITHSDSSLNDDVRVAAAARFLMEVTLFHRQFVGVRPSLIAWGSVVLARFICGKLRKPCPDFIAPDEALAVRVATAIDTILHESLDNVSEILIRKYANVNQYHRCSTFIREFYLSGRRFAPNPPRTSTAYVPYVSTPGLTPSSWAAKRSAATSPSGTYSCASSDAGDDPVTPITPISEPSPLDYVSVKDVSKENMVPSGAPTALKAMAPPAVAAVRPALQSIASSSEQDNRNNRRRSN
ncbi:hypothetical protein Q8F55_000164 [Vanrija albida]|uniref:Cyclin N-terminal domain-containing protein n=1 Tax=Vanrija albida TaxID=181172 RepID=A0ABR3QCH4_9TREE